MSGVDRERWMGRNWSLAILAAAPLAFAGCGGGESPSPVETAAATPGPPGDAHAAPPGAPAAGAHGAPTGAPLPGGAHGAPIAAPGDAHGAPIAAPGDSHAAPPSDPAAMHGGPEVAAAAPGDAHGGAGASGGPLAGSPAAAHGGGTSSSPAAAHGGSPTSSPAAAHGAPVAGGPGGAHGGPGGAPGQPAASPAASGEKPTTEEWIGGLAAGLFGSSAPAAAAPGDGYVPPGEDSAAAGGPLAAPGAAHGDAAAMEAGAPGAEGYSGAPGAEGGYEGAPGGGGQAKQFEEGTAEHTVQQFVLKAQSGDAAGLGDLISEKTKDPLLVALRGGQLDAESATKAKTLTAGANLVNVRTGPGTKSFVVQNGAGQTMTITAKREAGIYKVIEVKVAAPPRGRR